MMLLQLERSFLKQCAARDLYNQRSIQQWRTGKQTNRIEKAFTSLVPALHRRGNTADSVNSR
jgi:hypothetical protein